MNAVEIEEKLLEIMRNNRPGKDRGHRGSHMEFYDEEIQKQIVEPILYAAAQRGDIKPIDDLGHRLSFVAAWNRALEGKSEEWDCRCLASPMVSSALTGVKNFFDIVFGTNYDKIDNALLKNLPRYLSGKASPLITSSSLTSWATGDFIDMRMDGLQATLYERGGKTFKNPPALNAYLDSDPNPEPVEFFGAISFHSTNIDHDLSDKAWSAYRRACDNAKTDHHTDYNSKIGLINRQMRTREGLGFSQISLRQDESVSLEVLDDGFILYRGDVDGMKRMVDEGHLVCGPKSSFVDVLVDGGFEKSEAIDYLDSMAATDDAFIAKVPAGWVLRECFDPETFFAFDMPDDEMLYDIDKKDALPIYAAGTFQMPGMITHTQRALENEAAKTKEPEKSEEDMQP